MHKLGLETTRDRHLAFYLSPIVGHELSLPSLRRTVLFLTRSGNAFQTLFFTDFARDSQNSGKRQRAACFYTF